MFVYMFLPGKASDTTLVLQPYKTIPGSFSNFYTDNLQNIYVLSSATDQIKKLNANGDSVGVFNNTLRYGKIYSADVTNPLKILVYYKDFSTILILDRYLSTRAVIDLRKLNMTQVKAIAQSYDGNIWLYDEAEGKIKKIDDNNTVLLESADLRLVFDEALSPATIIDDNGELYLYDTNKGWLIFDYYTTFKTRLAYTNWGDVEVIDKKLYGHDATRFYYAAERDINYHAITPNISLSRVVKTQWQQNNLYALTNAGLQVYKKAQ